MIKELFLQKGWAGKTISRGETAERLNPIVKQHIVLNNDYGFVVAHHPDEDLRSELAATQKIARANVGKLCETIYSCGGVAYTGVDLEPDDVDLGSDARAMLERLAAGEDSLLESLKAEGSIEHQMRTRAILGATAQSSEDRLALLRKTLRQAR